jgi:hypothetical protein
MRVTLLEMACRMRMSYCRSDSCELLFSRAAAWVSADAELKDCLACWYWKLRDLARWSI